MRHRKERCNLQMGSQFPDRWLNMEVKATASAPGHHRRLQLGCSGAIRTALTERICHSHPALDVEAATPIETFLGPGAMVYDSCCLCVPVWLTT